jgi:hypothetical protein
MLCCLEEKRKQNYFAKKKKREEIKCNKKEIKSFSFKPSKHSS